MSRVGIMLPLAGAILAAASAAWADEAVTDAIIVRAERNEREAMLQSRLRSVPGATNLIDGEELRRRSTRTLEDAFAYQPGIVTQEFFGGVDQPRINIRGSGIQSNPLNRGLLLLENGLPINQADGSFIIGQIEPRAAAFIAVHRGANALRDGGATLGGSIDLQQFTGRDAAGGFARAEAGSFGYAGAQLAYGGSFGRGWDAYASLTHGSADGFRDLNASERDVITINAGLPSWSGAHIRLSYTYTDLAFDIPGPVSKDQLERDPQQVGASFPFFIARTTPQRASEIHRVALFGDWLVADGRFDFGIFAQNADDVFENQFRYGFTEARTYGGRLAFAMSTDRHAVAAGLWGNWGDMPRAFHLNNNWPGFGPIPPFTLPGSGEVGLRYGAADLSASNLVLFTEDRVALARQVDLVAGAIYARAHRNAAVEGRGRLDQDYDNFSPKIGLIFRPAAETDLFINLSRSFEAPTFDEIVTDQPLPMGRGVRATKLDAQTATTLEAGARGQWHGIRWDAAFYRAWVEDELLATTDAGGNSATRNYPATIHQGAELGIAGELWRAPHGESLSLRSAYTFSDFTFDGGRYDGNRIGGVPRHWMQAEFRYAFAGGFFVAPNIAASLEDTPTDHSNTLSQDAFALLGLTAGYSSPHGWTLFVEGKNLTDEHYASSALITDRPAFPYPSSNQQPVFTPGSGLSITMGISYAW